MVGGGRWREDPAISNADAVAVADLAVGGADAVGGGAMEKVLSPVGGHSNIGEVGKIFVTSLLCSGSRQF
jgi:hypothetical protein